MADDQSRGGTRSARPSVPYRILADPILARVDLSPACKVLMMALLQDGWSGGESVRSWKQLAEASGMSKNTVIRSAQTLASLGLIRIEEDWSLKTRQRIHLTWIADPELHPHANIDSTQIGYSASMQSTQNGYAPSMQSTQIGYSATRCTIPKMGTPLKRTGGIEENRIEENTLSEGVSNNCSTNQEDRTGDLESCLNALKDHPEISGIRRFAAWAVEQGHPPGWIVEALGKALENADHNIIGYAKKLLSSWKRFGHVTASEDKPISKREAKRRRLAEKFRREAEES